MQRKFSIKQIAAQAGLSKATTERVLNGRQGVRHSTMRRVQQALAELEAQDRAALASGRTFYFDVVMHTPQRFGRAVQAAMTSQVASMAPLRISPRFHLHEDIRGDELCRLLRRIASKGSQGVILKAADEPAINACVDELVDAGLPVVTLVTDLPYSKRLGYVGMDNRTAGRTAAYLMQRWLGDAPRSVGVVISSDRFRGEEEREVSFRLWLRERAPQLRVIDISGGSGIYERTLALLRRELREHADLDAIYSVGGGNLAVVDAFAEAGRRLACFIGHDLDEENRALLTREKIDALIDHDLQRDARHAFLHLLQFHRQVPAGEIPRSAARVVTPFNV